MHRIQLGVHGIGGDRRPGIDFAISLHMQMDAGIGPGDVRIYSTNSRAEGLVRNLEPYIRETLQPGLRVMIGNAGGELTFRHIYRYPRPNVRELLRWAEESYRLVGDRLVLGPMDFDIVDDVLVGGPFLKWCGCRGVPVAIFCGYRFLFRPGETGTMQGLQKKYPMDGPPGIGRYPFTKISETIRQSGAEVWTGAGHLDGLQTRVVERAYDFGMKGVFAKTSDMDRAPAELWRVRSQAERNGAPETNGAPKERTAEKPSGRNVAKSRRSAKK